MLSEFLKNKYLKVMINYLGKNFYLYQLYINQFYNGKSQAFTGNDPIDFKN